jgi:hypothetical protein
LTQLREKARNTNIHLGSVAMDQLNVSEFYDCTVQEIDLSNANREPTSQIGDTEKMKLFLNKIMQSDKNAALKRRETTNTNIM